MSDDVTRDAYVESFFRSKERLRKEDATKPFLEKLAVALSLGEFVGKMAEARAEGKLFIKQ